jgi:hypothetical protein
MFTVVILWEVIKYYIKIGTMPFDIEIKEIDVYLLFSPCRNFWPLKVPMPTVAKR